MSLDAGLPSAVTCTDPTTIEWQVADNTTLPLEDITLALDTTLLTQYDTTLTQDDRTLTLGDTALTTQYFQ